MEEYNLWSWHLSVQPVNQFHFKWCHLFCCDPGLKAPVYLKRHKTEWGRTCERVPELFLCHPMQAGGAEWSPVTSEVAVNWSREELEVCIAYANAKATREPESPRLKPRKMSFCCRKALLATKHTGAFRTYSACLRHTKWTRQDKCVDKEADNSPSLQMVLTTQAPASRL